MDAMDSNRYTIDQRCQEDDSKYCAPMPYKLAVSILIVQWVLLAFIFFWNIFSWYSTKFLSLEDTDSSEKI